MKKLVEVRQLVEIEIDESKFTPDFLAEFGQSIFDANLDDHFEHLGQLYARGIADEFSNFIEGYGPPKEMGITGKVEGIDVEIQR